MRPFSWRFAILLGITGVLTNTFWVAFNAYVPLFLQSGHPLAEQSSVVGFALSPFVANFIMTWDNIIHMAINPWAGARSDRTWNRFGRRKPWLLVGFPIAATGFILIPYATSIAAIMLFIMLTNFGTALYRTPLKAWVGDFYAPADRAKGESAVHLLAALAVAIVSILGGQLFDTAGRAAPFLLTIGLMAAAAIFIIFWVQESKATGPDLDLPSVASTNFLSFLKSLRELQNRNVLYATLSVIAFAGANAALQANMTTFAVFDINVTAGRAAQLYGLSAIAYVLFAIPSGLIATRVGARLTMLGGMLFYVSIMLSMILFVSTERLLLLHLLAGGVAWALVSVNGLPLLLNFDKDNRSGLFTGLYLFAFQFASILGPIIAGAAINVANSQRAMLLVASAFMAMAFVMLLRVNQKV